MYEGKIMRSVCLPVVLGIAIGREVEQVGRGPTIESPRMPPASGHCQTLWAQ